MATTPTRPTGSRAAVLALLRSPLHPLVSSSVCALRYTAPLSQRVVTLPVEYARTDRGFVVVAAVPWAKTWWRAFRLPLGVEVLDRGTWRGTVGRVVEGPERVVAVEAYRAAHPRTHVGPDDVVLVLGEGWPT